MGKRKFAICRENRNTGNPSIDNAYEISFDRSIEFKIDRADLDDNNDAYLELEKFAKDSAIEFDNWYSENGEAYNAYLVWRETVFAKEILAMKRAKKRRVYKKYFNKVYKSVSFEKYKNKIYTQPTSI